MKQRTVDNMIRLSETLYNANLVVSNGGNLSFRESYMPDRIRITASGSHLGFLEPEDFVPFDGVTWEQIGEGQKPSMETPFHLEVYQKTDIKMIVHVHAPAILKCFNNLPLRIVNQDPLRVTDLRGSYGIHVYNWETEALLPLLAVIPNSTSSAVPKHYTAPIIIPPSSPIKEVLLVEWLQETLQLLQQGKRIIIYGYHGVVAFGTTPLEVLNHLELLDSLVSLAPSNTVMEHKQWGE